MIFGGKYTADGYCLCLFIRHKWHHKYSLLYLETISPITHQRWGMNLVCSVLSRVPGSILDLFMPRANQQTETSAQFPGVNTPWITKILMGLVISKGSEPYVTKKVTDFHSRVSSEYHIQVVILQLGGWLLNTDRWWYGIYNWNQAESFQLFIQHCRRLLFKYRFAFILFPFFLVENLGQPKNRIMKAKYRHGSGVL